MFMCKSAECKVMQHAYYTFEHACMVAAHEAINIRMKKMLNLRDVTGFIRRTAGE
jgi:hypothetical protein